MNIIKIDWSRIKFVAREDIWYVSGSLCECECEVGNPQKSDDIVEMNCGLFGGYTNEIYNGFVGELPRPDGETCLFEEFDMYYNDIPVNDITCGELYELMKK